MGQHAADRKSNGSPARSIALKVFQNLPLSEGQIFLFVSGCRCWVNFSMSLLLCRVKKFLVIACFSLNPTWSAETNHYYFDTARKTGQTIKSLPSSGVLK
jgi:hypothetical protein